MKLPKNWNSMNNLQQRTWLKEAIKRVQSEEKILKKLSSDLILNKNFISKVDSERLDLLEMKE